MKIAIITSGFLPVVDGVTVSGYQRLQRLSQWGHEVLLFCPDYQSLADVYPQWREYRGAILPGVRVVNLPSTPFMDLDFERNVARQAHAVLMKELVAFQPDIVHVDEAERLFVGLLRRPGVAYARQAGIPCVSFLRTNFLDYAEDFFPLPPAAIALIKFLFIKLLQYVYNAYDLTLANSRLSQARIASEWGIRNTAKPFRILAGIDLNHFDPTLKVPRYFAQHFQLSEVDNKIKLAFIGRLTPDKGWDFSFQAFRQAVKVINPNQLAILVAGDGPLLAEIPRQLKILGLEQVHMLGRVTPEQIPSFLANSDLHITTSEKETRGLTVLEAMAVGIPALAPRSGGVAETIEDGQDSLLYEPQDIADFTRQLQRLIENPILRQELGDRGRQKILAQYDWDVAVKNLLAIWEEQITLKSLS